MDPNYPNYFGMFAGLGILAFVIWLVVTALIVWLAIWIQYTIMWKAVRRGMREFHTRGNAVPQAQVLPPAQ